MPSEIIPQTLQYLLDQRSTCALLDVREHGEYNAAHIPGASSLPRRLIEFRLRRLVPSEAVQIVVYDDDGRRAWPAARTIERMGYQRVAVLEGGVNRWAWLGHPTEWGMNVLGKDFGERVQVQHQVPTIEATELNRRIESGQPVIVLDVRTRAEYAKASIPGARCAPGGELALQIGEIARTQPKAAVVVTCAGRPRSILATRLLQRMGMRNVYGLRNGTSGWALAGLQLERDPSRFDLPSPGPEALEEATAFAARIAEEDGVGILSARELRELMVNRRDECVYFVDVRTEAEFAAGHIPGFWWFPGGEAILHFDDVMAVRNASIVFCCDGIVRAMTVASWYRQMGISNVLAVGGGTAAWTALGLSLEGGNECDGPPPDDAAERWQKLSPHGLQLRLTQEQPLVIFVDTSVEFANGHVPGARWILRSWLDIRIGEFVEDKARPIVVTDANGGSAALAAATLEELGCCDIAVLDGGMAAWRSAALPIERGLSGVMTPPEDVVPTGADRPYHQMINYLRWEEGLGRKYEPQNAHSIGRRLR